MELKTCLAIFFIIFSFLLLFDTYDYSRCFLSLVSFTAGQVHSVICKPVYAFPRSASQIDTRFWIYSAAFSAVISPAKYRSASSRIIPAIAEFPCV